MNPSHPREHIELGTVAQTPLPRDPAECSPLIPGYPAPQANKFETCINFLKRHIEPKPWQSTVSILKCSPSVTPLVGPGNLSYYVKQVIFHFVQVNINVEFACSFLAMLPMATILGFVVEDISFIMNKVSAVFFRCTMGNIIELIAGILSITSCQLDLLKASLAGSVLVNVLLVLGIACIAGGTAYKESNYQVTANQACCTLLVASTIVTLMPTILATAISGAPPSELDRGALSILTISHVIALFLLPL
ncbi:hypothetical protein B0H14DRAFT_2654119 [Mycena olivaceomarginata]|nr:hypothetical protein B0H14DRAFT_2654119 [Mycena olivaceomarginata]